MTATSMRMGKKTIGLKWQNNNSHVHHLFLYISLPSLHDYDMKMANFTFLWRTCTPDNDFLLLLLNFHKFNRDKV